MIYYAVIVRVVPVDTKDDILPEGEILGRFEQEGDAMLLLEDVAESSWDTRYAKGQILAECPECGEIVTVEEADNLTHGCDEGCHDIADPFWG